MTPTPEQTRKAFKIANRYALPDLGKMELEKLIAEALASERAAALEEAAQACLKQHYVNDEVSMPFYRHLSAVECSAVIHALGGK